MASSRLLPGLATSLVVAAAGLTAGCARGTDGGFGGGRGSGGALSSSSLSTSGGGTCSIAHLVINEIRSRGPGGANDEFIVLYNPTASPVTLDASWKIEARKAVGATYTARWAGTGKTIPAHGYFLLANSTGYTQSPMADEALTSGVTDTSSVRLAHAGAPVDAVCYYATAAMATVYDGTFTCEGTPVSNAPHSDGGGAGSDVDASIKRRPCIDTDDNAADFVAQMPATPDNAASPPGP